ncbi:hypothetical protein PoB_002456700 [Plakobranchus ocellatus]|uniref:Uncharacterized protein n=1 Tax=Plakobranchus ocellatus TaxID=259542 RepID=A0AAV3ZU41_9GAST|nr:hypothetical protein PoB_002456700 [Plakobranchus ocellatus]
MPRPFTDSDNRATSSCPARIVAQSLIPHTQVNSIHKGTHERDSETTGQTNRRDSRRLSFINRVDGEKRKGRKEGEKEGEKGERERFSNSP